MKRIRTVIGLFLIAAAISGFIYWELAGRESVLMDTFLVAKGTILPGTVVKATHFTEAGILTKIRSKERLHHLDCRRLLEK